MENQSSNNSSQSELGSGESAFRDVPSRTPSKEWPIDSVKLHRNKIKDKTPNPSIDTTQTIFSYKNMGLSGGSSYNSLGNSSHEDMSILGASSLSKNSTIPNNPAFSWAFFNCATTMRMAGLLLLAGGLFSLITGAVIASTAVVTAGAVITGVGATLVFFGQSPQPVQSGLEKDEILVESFDDIDSNANAAAIYF